MLPKDLTKLEFAITSKRKYTPAFSSCRIGGGTTDRTMWPSNAGFFLWIDLSACLRSATWQDEDELRQGLYDHGVEMSAGHAYHDEKPGNFRFLFSMDRDTLEEGLRRVIGFHETRRLDRS